MHLLGWGESLGVCWLPLMGLSLKIGTLATSAAFKGRKGPLTDGSQSRPVDSKDDGHAESVPEAEIQLWSSRWLFFMEAGSGERCCLGPRTTQSAWPLEEPESSQRWRGRDTGESGEAPALPLPPVQSLRRSHEREVPPGTRQSLCPGMLSLEQTPSKIICSRPAPVFLGDFGLGDS